MPLLLVTVFSYSPIINGFVHIFYRWDGDAVEEFVGLGNVIKVLHDTDLWRAFGIVGIFIVAYALPLGNAEVTGAILEAFLGACGEP